jgi:hypothetical protein
MPGRCSKTRDNWLTGGTASQSKLFNLEVTRFTSHLMLTRRIALHSLPSDLANGVYVLR